jgi:hypothetical protein
LYAGLRTGDGKDPFHATRHYLAVADLRPFGYDAVLHAHCKHGVKGNHKLELTGTGRRAFSELVKEIQRIFMVDTMRLELMRVDLTADIVGIPVAFFQDAFRAAYKQVANDIEKADQFVRMGRGEIQTIYLGSRPNCFRIYNKDNTILTRFIKPAARTLGIGWVNWQVLRRSHATWLKLVGADVKDATAQMRHSRVTTTLELYQQFIPESQRRAVNKLIDLTGTGLVN